VGGGYDPRRGRFKGRKGGGSGTLRLRFLCDVFKGMKRNEKYLTFGVKLEDRYLIYNWRKTAG
jgi:hypothetical protein